VKFRNTKSYVRIKFPSFLMPIQGSKYSTTILTKSIIGIIVMNC
jgi:hypothetical protein